MVNEEFREIIDGIYREAAESALADAGCDKENLALMRSGRKGRCRSVGIIFGWVWPPTTLICLDIGLVVVRFW